MARPLRVDVPDGWYHCMNRGIDRNPIFSDHRSYEHFVERLAETVERFRFRIHAYCLMSNHYHAIIQTPDANLSQGMQWLGVCHSSWYNARHDRVGPLFQGRFKSVPVQDGQWALELSSYIHLNPVRIQALGLDKRSQRAASQGILPHAHEGRAHRPPEGITGVPLELVPCICRVQGNAGMADDRGGIGALCGGR